MADVVTDAWLVETVPAVVEVDEASGNRDEVTPAVTVEFAVVQTSYGSFIGMKRTQALGVWSARSIVWRPTKLIDAKPQQVRKAAQDAIEELAKAEAKTAGSKNPKKVDLYSDDTYQP